MGWFSSLSKVLDVAQPLVSIGSQVAGSVLGANSQEAQVREQEDFAKHGVQWRVEDANRAGINPLAALGFSSPGFNPVGGTDPWAAGLSSVGQNLERAQGSSMSADDRRLKALLLRREAAGADLAESQAAHARWELMRDTHPPNPAVPDSPDTQMFVDRYGRRYLMPSESFARSERGDPSARWDWMLRNKIFAPMGEIDSGRNEGWNAGPISIDRSLGTELRGRVYGR